MIWHICRLNKRQIKPINNKVFLFSKSIYNAILFCFCIMPLYIFLHERPLHCPHETAWCTVAEFGIWGPYFFAENNVTVTVNSDRHCEMLKTSLKIKINMFQDMDCLVSTGWGNTNSPHFSTYSEL